MLSGITFKILMKEEGFRDKPYYCSEGFPTIGYGFRVGNKHDPLPEITMSREYADKKLSSHIRDLISTLNKNPDLNYPFSKCNNARKAIMISMAFQIGIYGLLKFKNFLHAVRIENWDKAAEEMINSLAYKQTPHRWERQAMVMRVGSVNGIYD